MYGLIATALCVLIGYPVAYWIAFYGGKHKSTLLFLLLLPFFVSFVIRMLAVGDAAPGRGRRDEGTERAAPRRRVLRLHASHHAVPAGAHQITQTHLAVVGGLVYNFLPFTILPIYVSLERVSPALLEAASDLYANKVLRS